MRAMYLLIAAALVISLIITAAPALKVSAADDDDVDSEWTRVGTPTMDGFVLAPESEIIDYALGDGGEVAYAAMYAWDEDGVEQLPRLLKSTDSGATWDDLTSAVQDEAEDELFDADTTPADPLDDDYIDWFEQVATDWVDPDFVAVALWWYDWDTDSYFLHVFISNDGGATFVDTGRVEDGAYLTDVADLAVSVEVAGTRDMAIGGYANDGYSGLFRCTVTGGTAGAWVDATEYDGWDDETRPTSFTSYYVIDILFAPSWAADKTILVLTADEWNTDDDGWMYGDVHLQSGTWGTTKGWNEQSTLAIDAVRIKDDVWLPIWGVGYYDYRGIGGITAPVDYSGRNSANRVLWVWVNYLADGATAPTGEIIRVKNTSTMPINQQIEEQPWLTNVSYWGYIAEGKAIAGLLGTGTMSGVYNWTDLIAPCGEGVQVYRNTQITNMDICCLPWEAACKPPTGVLGMAVSYVSDDKAYAVALYGIFDIDEGAWSVNWVDDGDTWNQLSLIDTEIDYISDVAVSPDCNKTFLVTVNYPDDEEWCYCDSVWLKAVNLPEAEEYSGKWLRTWCGQLLGDNYDTGDGYADFPDVDERGLLRLNPEETTGDTVYLLDRMSDTVYWNELETLACWDMGTASIDNIVDLAVTDKETIYALDKNGNVAMSDDFAIGWHESVESELDYGWTIAVHGDNILVGGQNGDVSYSDDGGETFTELEDVAAAGLVTVAFDTYFDQNDTIYAALAMAGVDSGIYLWVMGESETWYKLSARPYEYTGLVLSNANGNPFTSPETGGVLYASYIGVLSASCEEGVLSGKDGGDYETWVTGVARCLTPIVEICCGMGEAEWDYLTWGLEGYEKFAMAPQALKICGCLTADSNSKLFAIGAMPGEREGSMYYDMDEGQDGTVWTFEDCYAKKAVEITSPVEGFVVPADPCTCSNVPFTVKWDRLCDACSYDIQFSLDEDFEDAMEIWHVWPDAPMTPSLWVDAGEFTCEFTYYWRVRAADAETCQWIHSWWSEPRSFTIAPSVVAAQINLVSPKPGATKVARTGVGFSWNMMASADAFDWVLSKNANLSSPVESKTGLTDTAYACTKTLDYGTTYYWQVTAYKEGSAISVSPVGTFTTAVTGAFCCPQDGLCFATQAELEAHTADVHGGAGATPFWVWVVIAIGAVLVIVVIVLIFRTRRV
jgi:hypothetical protein